MRVCIIGAGPSGMSALCAFQDLKNKGQECPDWVCFEKQDEIGGLWNFNWRTGMDKDGTPVHNGMYRHLWSNGPKEALEFPDYPFETHYGTVTGSYPPRIALRDYLMGWVHKHHKIDMSKVRCKTVVKNVVWKDDVKKFEVSVKNPQTQYSELFDHVIVCSGHFSTPRMPDFPDLNKFAGTIIHSHDFRNAAAYKGQNVVVIGGSYSAEDVVSQCYKFGSKLAVMCHRKKGDDGKWKATGFDWPKGIEERPLIKSIEGKVITFEDGSSLETDAIIMSTGYMHHFPFLDSKISQEMANTMYTRELDFGTVSKKNQNLFFIGMEDQFYTFNHFAAKAWWIREVIMGRKQRMAPKKDAQGKYWNDEDFIKLLDALTDEKSMYHLQGKHNECCMIEGGYGNNVDVAKFIATITQQFDDWEDIKHHDIMGYRNNAHTSPVTYNKAPMPNPEKPWLKNCERDDLDFYLNIHK